MTQQITPPLSLSLVQLREIRKMVTREQPAGGDRIELTSSSS
jgi:hypothetical protein